MAMWKTEQKIRHTYKDAKSVRFSCAYLFRIKVDDDYLLVKDEQGRGTFQPVGGVYKYTDDSFFSKLQAIQCTRFGNASDLDNDLRIIVPREHVKHYEHWYRKEHGRETPENLYREFQEEILDRIDIIDDSVFKTISYRYIGEHIEASRWGERNVQIHIADVVELIPTPQQKRQLANLRNYESNIYRFATKEEIYNLGRSLGNQVMSISPHTTKILEEEASNLTKTKRTGKTFECSRPIDTAVKLQCDWVGLQKTDLEKPFTFISYQSDHKRTVWDFCRGNNPPLTNIWIDKKEVGELWIDNLKKAINTGKCEKAVLFINNRYLIRSTPCYEEAMLVVEHKIPHVIVLVDMDQKNVIDIIQTWISNDGADKEKLRVFKKLFHYNDDTAHLDGTFFFLPGVDMDWFLQVLENLGNEK